MARTSILRLVVGVVAAMATWAGGNARSSAAETEPVALIWNAPVGCPTTQALHDQVESALGASLKTLAPVAAAVSVVEASQGRWRASLMVHSHGQHAERQFEAESCAALAEAAALIIALAAETPDAGSTPADRPPQHRADQPAEATPPSYPPRRGSAWSRAEPFTQFGILLDSGTMPEVPGLGFEAVLGESWTNSLWRLRLMAGPTFLGPQNPDELDQVQSPGRFWLLSLSARGCLTAALSRFEIGPCLGGELVAMRGTSLGGGDERSNQYWAAPMGSLLAAFAVTPRVVLFARTDIVVPSTRRTFLSTQRSPYVDILYTVPAFALRAAIGVELRLF